MSFARAQRWHETPAVPEQVQDEDHQHHVFPERLPWRELDGIAETSAVCYFIENGRISRKKLKEHHEDKQYPGGNFHSVVDENCYAEGHFRGDRLLYAELEYRASLTRNNLIGMVVFLNATTVSDRTSGQRLFDRVAPGGGAGLRVLFSKESRTNLCIDVGFGERGARGLYFGLQEAF